MITSDKLNILTNGNYGTILANEITGACETIDIIMFDWRIYPIGYNKKISVINTSLMKAVLRGVKVRALVNSNFTKTQLLKMGVSAKLYEQKNMLHTKLVIIDGKIIICGSHNLTESAMSSNEELSVIFQYRNNDNVFVNYFNNLYPL